MAANDQFYRRDGDRLWRERTDERIINLQAGQVTQNDRLDAIAEQIQEIKDLLEGDARDRRDNGIKGDIHDLDLRLNRLWAVTFADPTGERTVVAERRDHRWEVRLNSRTVIVAAVITTFGLVWNEWKSEIKGLFHPETPVMQLERLHKERDEMAKTRGPEVKKRLAAIEDEINRREGPAMATWH